jgi:hypothetical protein
MVVGAASVAFHPKDGVGLLVSYLSGLNPAARRTRCLRFAARVAPRPRKTRLSVLTELPTRGWLPGESLRGLSHSLLSSCFLLPGLPGATSARLSTIDVDARVNWSARWLRPRGNASITSFANTRTSNDRW